MDFQQSISVSYVEEYHRVGETKCLILLLLEYIGFLNQARTLVGGIISRVTYFYMLSEMPCTCNFSAVGTERGCI